MITSEKASAEKSYGALLASIGFIIFIIAYKIISAKIPSGFEGIGEVPFTGIALTWIGALPLALLIAIGIVLSILMAEWLFIDLAKDKKFKKDKNKKVILTGFKIVALLGAPCLTIFSLGVLLLIVVGIEMVFIVLSFEWMQILMSIGVAGLIVFIIWLNVEFVGSKYVKDETDKDYKTRMKLKKDKEKLKEEKKKAREKADEEEEKKEIALKYKGKKFIPGEFVRVKEGRIDQYSGDSSLGGEIVTIEEWDGGQNHYHYHVNGGDYTFAEDDLQKINQTKAKKQLEKEEWKDRKFKKGEKVRVNKGVVDTYSSHQKYAGKIATIDSYNEDDEAYWIKEQHKWYMDDDLTKIKGKKKRSKKKSK